MHCFGAVDLYAASDYVTQAHVDHLRVIRSNDIMFSIDYRDPDHIGESFSDLDAYYLGLVTYNADQQAYGLRRSSMSRSDDKNSGRRAVCRCFRLRRLFRKHTEIQFVGRLDAGAVEALAPFCRELLLNDVPQFAQ